MLKYIQGTFITISLLLSISCLSQNTRKEFFSEAISAHLKKYNQKINKAYESKDYERAQFIFDSLVQHHIRGTYLDNFKVNCLDKRIDCFADYKKPLFMITYASWCVPTQGEIPALNELAKKHHKEIDFVVLFWDKRKEVRSASKKYNKFIDILYVDELDNASDNVVKKLKHSLGFPISFFLASDKKIVDIKRTVFHPVHISFTESYNLNYNVMSQGISNLLANKGEEDNTTWMRL